MSAIYCRKNFDIHYLHHVLLEDIKHLLWLPAIKFVANQGFNET